MGGNCLFRNYYLVRVQIHMESVLLKTLLRFRITFVVNERKKKTFQINLLVWILN